MWHATQKPEGFSWIKKCLTQETNINTVLAEKMVQFKLPAAHTIRVPEGEAQGFAPIRRPRACCHIQPQTGLQF
jgi:hypothetical protein